MMTFLMELKWTKREKQTGRKIRMRKVLEDGLLICSYVELRDQMSKTKKTKAKEVVAVQERPNQPITNSKT